MGRVYRATINGLISTADGARLTFMLRERRCTQEAINAEAALAIANAPPPPPGDFHLNILTIPEGRFLTHEQMSADYDWKKEIAAAETAIETELIEHMPQAKPPVAEPEPIAAPAQPELDPIMQRAMEMGYTPLPRRIHLVE